MEMLIGCRRLPLTRTPRRQRQVARSRLWTRPAQHPDVINALFRAGLVAAARISDLFNPASTAADQNVDNQPQPDAWARL
jgi:hypothetical protein